MIPMPSFGAALHVTKSQKKLSKEDEKVRQEFSMFQDEIKEKKQKNYSNIKIEVEYPEKDCRQFIT